MSQQTENQEEEETLDLGDLIHAAFEGYRARLKAQEEAKPCKK